MAKKKKTRAPKKRIAAVFDDIDGSGLNLSTKETDVLFPTTDGKGTKEDANIESGPTGGHEKKCIFGLQCMW